MLAPCILVPAALRLRPHARLGDSHMRTLAKVVVGLFSIGVFVLPARGRPGDAPPAMKFNDVREVAPGVFFRYSAISATDPSVVFGGCNNTWVVFKDYVVVIDATFPQEDGDVLSRRQ